MMSELDEVVEEMKHVDILLWEKAAVELAGMKEELNHRFVRCTFCDWGYSYLADEKGQADKDANEHAAKCEADPRNKELAALREQVEQLQKLVRLHHDRKMVRLIAKAEYANRACPVCEGGGNA